MFQLPPPISSPLQTFEHALYSTVISAMSALLDVQYMHFFMEADHMVLIVIVISNLFKCGISKVRDKDGTVMTALTSHQCGLLLIPALCHMWVEFDVGSRLAPRVLLHVLWCSSLHKNQHWTNSKSTCG